MSTSVSLKKSTTVHAESRTWPRWLAAPPPGILAPWLARRFFTPHKRATPLDLNGAREVLTLGAGKRRVRVGVWGEGPLVVLVHGWAGSGSQFNALRSELLRRGMSVACFDAPAHGASPAANTSVFEFVEVIRELHLRLGASIAIVGHSLGGTAAAVAASRTPDTTALILLSPMPSFEFALEGFASGAGLPLALKVALAEAITKRFPAVSQDLQLTSLRPLPRHVLIIHDQTDKAIDVRHSRELHRHWPLSQLHVTAGLGHNRILLTPDVMSLIANFLERLPRRPATPLDRQLEPLSAVSFA